MNDPFAHPWVRQLVAAALAEDVGRGDVTTDVTIEPGRSATGVVRTRVETVVAGLPIARLVFEALGAPAELTPVVVDGAKAPAGTVLLEIRTSARALLSAERVVLNFLQRMCGVATLTGRFVERAAGTKARIVDTRKTIPGWRLLDKYAVRMGGGTNHRSGLDDGILIKDNHIVACGGLAAAVVRARSAAPHLLKVEVECETLAEVDEALAAGADVILLDNMTVGDMTDAVRRIAGRAVVEASGTVSLERVREIAATGVDLISAGTLTHSAPAVDLTLELVVEGPPSAAVP